MTNNVTGKRQILFNSTCKRESKNPFLNSPFHLGEIHTEGLTESHEK